MDRLIIPEIIVLNVIKIFGAVSEIQKIYLDVTTEITSNKHHPLPCEVRGTALVEQFFNIVFAEFHHSPPSCICVQMCLDHPTYCYPNGCFRRTEKKHTPVSRIHHEGGKMFLVDNDKDFLADVMENIEAVASVGTVDPTERILNSKVISRPNLFKENVFKYKRIPKLEMKYNLREQVKHTKEKRAEVDVSKTRWPTNKHLNRYPYKLKHHSLHSASILSETNQPEPKFFKRYLTKRENQNGLDIGALYLYKDASNFSLETLIDNLIERGLQDINSSRLEITNATELNDGENKGDSKLMNNGSEDMPKESIGDDNAINLTFCDQQPLINYTTTIDENAYKDDIIVANSTVTYFDMMTTLSKEIEKQNNRSIETVKRMIGEKFENISKGNSTIILSEHEFDSRREDKVDDHKTSTKTANSKKPGNKVPASHHKEFIPVINGQVKKNKQRVVRKLRNRKLNS